MIDIIKRNKEVKKILSREFGFNNVSVKNDRGTAYGWCKVNIYNIEKPKDCYCDKKELNPYGYHCRNCLNKLNKITDTAYKLLRDIKFYTYYDDMNYEHKEIIVQAHFLE